MGENRYFLHEMLIKSRVFILSGILSGFVFYFAIQHTEADAPEHLVAQFGAQWFPGLIYGILFAFFNKWTKTALISYSSISAFAYFCAYWIAQKYYTEISENFLIAGILAGGFGAFILVYVLSLFSGTTIDSREYFVVSWIGAFTGAIFLEILFDVQFVHPVLRSCFVFAFWQSSVGIKIQDLNQRVNKIEQISDVEKKIAIFLQGPIVQLAGLIASILGILSYFSK